MTFINSNGNQHIINVLKEEREFFVDFTKEKGINWPIDQQKNNILIISASLVGYIITPKREILLKPKYQEINFNHILRIYLYLNSFHKNDDSKLLNVSANNDVDVARMFLDSLENQMKDGILREYKEKIQSTDDIIGRVNFAKTVLNIKKNKKKPVLTTVRNLSTDNSINRLIAGALIKLRNHKNYALRANEALNFFWEVSNPVTTKGHYYLQQIVFNSINNSYREIATYAAMLIDYTDYSDLGSSTGVQSFLINFDTLFEDFIIAITTESGEENKFSTWKQKKLLTNNIVSDYELYYQPDLLYDFDSDSPLNNFKPYSFGVLDVKNKAYGIFKNADVYQLLTYANALNSKKAVLIYPSFSEINTQKICFDYELFDPSEVYGEYINIAEYSGDDFLNSISIFKQKLFNTLLH